MARPQEALQANERAVGRLLPALVRVPKRPWARVSEEVAQENEVLLQKAR